MRVIGLDLGEKTIGVAVSDPLGLTAQGIETIKRNNLESDLKRLQELCQEWQVTTLVLGMPRNMNGTYGPRAESTREFGQLLEQELKLPVKYWDERLTTVAAEKMLLQGDLSRRKRKKVIDKIAAVMILQGFLDNHAVKSTL